MKTLLTFALFVFTLMSSAQEWTFTAEVDGFDLMTLPQFGNDPTLSFLWDYGDGNTFQGLNAPLHTYASQGNYTVCLSATDLQTGLPVGSAFCLTVVVPEFCPPPDPSFSIDLTEFSGDNCGKVGLCVDGNLGFDLADYCVNWDFGDGVTFSMNAFGCITHQFGCQGTYDICATIYCCAAPLAILHGMHAVRLQLSLHCPDRPICTPVQRRGLCCNHCLERCLRRIHLHRLELWRRISRRRSE